MIARNPCYSIFIFIPQIAARQGRWVLDASAALHVVMRLPTAEPVIDKLEQATLVLAPQLYFSETANALWKYVSHQRLSAEQAIEQRPTYSNCVLTLTPVFRAA